MLPALVRSWRSAFADYPEVVVLRGDLFEVEADAYVSPANGFGIMDGGIDGLLSARFPGVESRVREAIGQTGGPLPVGEALVVETGDADVPFLICAPTMLFPARVDHTDNAYLAMRAVMAAIDSFNAAGESEISTVAVPGLCTGVGRMAPDVAAAQMARAYREWRSDRDPNAR